MPNLQVKDIPEELHRQLRALAERQGRTLRDVVLEAVRREVSREAFRERLARRAPVELGHGAGATVDEVRAEREQELER